MHAVNKTILYTSKLLYTMNTVYNKYQRNRTSMTRAYGFFTSLHIKMLSGIMFML